MKTWLFKLIWHKRLSEMTDGLEHPYKVFKVVGWRTVLLDGHSGSRIRTTFLFGKKGW